MTTLDGRAGARRSTRAVFCGATALLLGTALAACGNDSGTSSGSGTTAAAGSGNCGTVPQKGFTDNSGVVNSLGSTYTEAYNGYNGSVQASTWASWKPKGSGPYRIGISVSQLSNPYQVGLLNGLKASLAKQKNIAKVITLVSSDQAANQVQQFRSLIAQKVDFIIYQPLSPDAFVAPAEEAAKAGIPSLSILNNTPTKDTVNLVPNAFLQGADTAAGVVKAAGGGAGTILGIHGIPGVAVDTQSFSGIKAVLSQCSGMKLDDSVTGQFQDAVAKTEVQKYLTSHPGKIAGAVMGGPMSTGVINAFKQAGRTVPPVAAPGGEISTLAYWRDNKGYTTAGTGMGPNSLADAAIRVTEKMLAGDGIKVSDIVVRQTVITNDNLSQWADSSATVSTPGSAEGPAENFAPDSYLAPLFTKSS